MVSLNILKKNIIIRWGSIFIYVIRCMLCVWILVKHVGSCLLYPLMGLAFIHFACCYLFIVLRMIVLFLFFNGLRSVRLILLSWVDTCDLCKGLLEGFNCGLLGPFVFSAVVVHRFDSIIIYLTD